MTISGEVKKKEKQTDIDKDSHEGQIWRRFVLRAYLAWCLLSLVGFVKEPVPHYSACSAPWTWIPLDIHEVPHLSLLLLLRLLLFFSLVSLLWFTRNQKVPASSSLSSSENMCQKSCSPLDTVVVFRYWKAGSLRRVHISVEIGSSSLILKRVLDMLIEPSNEQSTLAWCDSWCW